MGSATKPAAGVLRSGKKNVALKIYGQVNRAVIVADDSVESRFFHVDNDISSSRIGLEGTAEVDDNFGVGAKIETEIQENPSNKITIADEDDEDSQGGFAVRKVEFWLKDSRLGKLTIGQGSEAHDGAAEVDLSGTGLVTSSLQGAICGELVFRISTTNGLSGVPCDNVFSNFDGSRDDRVRYDTPKIAGFTASVVGESDDRWGLALKWGGKFGGVKAAAKIARQAVTAGNDGAEENVLVGSLSAALASGFSVTFASGKKDVVGAGREQFYWYGKLGHRFKMLPWGKTAISFDYYASEDMVATGDDGNSIGVGLVQKIDKASIELYVGLRKHGYDRPAVNYEDIVAASIGGRVKF